MRAYLVSGEFRVHRADCRDCEKEARRSDSPGDAEDYASQADVIASQELFSFRAEGDGTDGETPGRFVSAGLRPRFLAKAEQCGLGPLLLRAISYPDDPALI